MDEHMPWRNAGLGECGAKPLHAFGANGRLVAIVLGDGGEDLQRRHAAIARTQRGLVQSARVDRMRTDEMRHGTSFHAKWCRRRTPAPSLNLANPEHRDRGGLAITRIGRAQLPGDGNRAAAECDARVTRRFIRAGHGNVEVENVSVREGNGQPNPGIAGQRIFVRHDYRVAARGNARPREVATIEYPDGSMPDVAVLHAVREPDTGSLRRVERVGEVHVAGCRVARNGWSRARTADHRPVP